MPMTPDDDLHAGHRSRLRTRFVAEGLDGFEDHQVLELLLFYAIPRRDTNEIAHLLLTRYGSLSAVLEADPADLAATPGIGEAAASLLALVPAMTRRYAMDRARQDRTVLDSTERAAAFAVPLMAGRTEEVFYVVCLDSRLRVLVPALVSEGMLDHARVEPRRAVEAALRHKAHSVILAHNHPNGKAKPSTADHAATRALCAAFDPIGIAVRDHLVIAGEEWYSFTRAGDLARSRDAKGTSS